VLNTRNQCSLFDWFHVALSFELLGQHFYLPSVTSRRAFYNAQGKVLCYSTCQFLVANWSRQYSL